MGHRTPQTLFARLATAAVLLIAVCLSGPWATATVRDASCGGPVTCPAGMTLIGDGNDRESYCIETNPRAAANQATAIANCLIANRHLCKRAEWLGACGAALGSMPGAWEWASDVAPPTDSSALALGGTTCSSISYPAASTSYAYRCCSK